MSRLYPLLCVLASCGIAYASPLTPEQALARFSNSASSHAPTWKAPSATPLKLTETYGNLYVFSNGEGFAILPADDLAPALLGYSDNGHFDLSGNPALAGWMEFYNSQIEQQKSIHVNDPTKEPSRTSERKMRPAIEPLIKTEWNQESPYNELCPKVDGHETVTGCVATAMAQAMKFYNYPAHGKGTHSYYWHPGEEELSFDYENTSFQWDLMTDRYDSSSTEEERHAVAELMLACGISVDMHYEPGESGAATTAMGTAFIDIFGYSPGLWMPNRAYYGYYEWEDMIYQELSEGHPIPYSGAGTAGGHQFICDGYDGDGYFHFNWGWGGLSNGYFLLTALNPDDLGVGGGAGGFNTSQVATLGMRPATEGDEPVYLFYNTEAFSTDVGAVKVGEDFRCGGLYFNYSLYTMPDGSRLGMRFKEASGTESWYAEGPSVAGYHPDDGRNDIQVKFPDLADGTYEITPALKVDGRWYDVRMPVGCARMVTAVVKDKVASIADTQGATIRIVDISLPATIYRNREFPLTFKAENSSGMEYYGTVTPVLLDASGSEVAKSNFRPLDVMPQCAEDVSDYIGDFSAVKGKELAEGEYKLVFKDKSGRGVSDPVDVTLSELTEETEIKVTDFRLEDTNPVADPSKVKFSFTLSCTRGLFFGEVELLIFPASGIYDRYHKSSTRRYLVAGEESQETIETDLQGLEDGEYLALIYSEGKAISDRVYLKIDRVGTGMSSPSTDTTRVKIYDLQGRPLATPNRPGIYVINGQKILYTNSSRIQDGH